MPRIDIVRGGSQKRIEGSFNPKTVVDESGVYAAPTTISVIKYVLNVAVANNALLVLTGYHSDSNRYLL